MPKRLVLDSRLIPQANKPERMLECAKHFAKFGTRSWPEDFTDKRDRSYYRQALITVGVLDRAGNSTPALYEWAESREPTRYFSRMLGSSELGLAWLRWDKVRRIEDLDPARTIKFLRATTKLSLNTLDRRTRCLRRWLQWCQTGEASLDALEPNWPSQERFPINEDGRQVRDTLREDLADGDVVIIVGYASLSELVRFVGERGQEAGNIRILFGNEPFPYSKHQSPRKKLTQEVQDYWLERGFSVDLAADIIDVCERLKNGNIRARIAPRGRMIHAKIFASPQAVTLGSSNFTPNGLADQSEANTRFEASHERFQEGRDLAEGLWDLGDDYREELLALLERLLKAVEWQTALARGCAEVLEGHWARHYLEPSQLESLSPGLWAHQLQGISQAMWILYNLGSVLIADATGSGKTRMGAWILRGARDRQLGMRGEHRDEPVVIAPPAIVDDWEISLDETSSYFRVCSSGLLSHTGHRRHTRLVAAIENTELLAIDEAHNFINQSGRTGIIRHSYADNVVLFTATPINRGASDLLGMVELLGADNFSNEAQKNLQVLWSLRRSGGPKRIAANAAAAREEIQKFLVRRTREDLNRISVSQPDRCLLSDGRVARYPAQEAHYYELPTSKRDTRLLKAIFRLLEKLRGVARFQKPLKLTPMQVRDGMSEATFLAKVMGANAALAKYLVLDCLRSSRLALYEHVHGTEAALREFFLDPVSGKSTSSGNMAAKLADMAGHPPTWGLTVLEKPTEHAWLWDGDAHRAACVAEKRIYEQIAELAREMSDEREVRKVEKLIELRKRRGVIIGFESHILTLALLEQHLFKRGEPVEVFSGVLGARGKIEANRKLGVGSQTSALIALCSDALSEGMNLQHASAMIHLDSPTVVKQAEQRSGRIDRMNSEHETVEVWWPRDMGEFAIRRQELLRPRLDVVAALMVKSQIVV